MKKEVKEIVAQVESSVVEKLRKEGETQSAKNRSQVLKECEALVTDQLKKFKGNGSELSDTQSVIQVMINERLSQLQQWVSPNQLDEKIDQLVAQLKQEVTM